MDIWGVDGVEAEAELLSAIVKSFTDMGFTSSDVGIKINSRKILTSLMASFGVPEDKFAATCVLVDKLEKVPLDAIEGDLEALGLTKPIIQELVASLQVMFRFSVLR
jgi:histidyl-tRNA synthetase